MIPSDNRVPRQGDAGAHQVGRGDPELPAARPARGARHGLGQLLGHIVGVGLPDDAHPGAAHGPPPHGERRRGAHVPVVHDRAAAGAAAAAAPQLGRPHPGAGPARDPRATRRPQ